LNTSFDTQYSFNTLKRNTDMKTLLAIAALSIASLLFAPASGVAQTPRTMSFQGMLSDAGGRTIADGRHIISIALYDAPQGGTPLFTERHDARVENGIFAVTIGSVTPLPAKINFTEQYWLGVTLDNGDEMSPRTALSSAPYALGASEAMSLSRNATNGIHSINGEHGAITVVGEGGTSITMNNNVMTISSPTATGGSGGTELTLPYAGYSKSQADALAIQNRGYGRAGNFATIDPENPSSTLYTATNGTGSAAEILIHNSSSTADALTVRTNGKGHAISATSGTTAIEGSNMNLNSGALGAETAGVLGTTSLQTSDGVRGISASDSAGAGVRGENSGMGYGVIGTTRSKKTTMTAGVLGENRGAGIGVKGTSVGASGTGVFGEATATTGFAAGVVGLSSSPNGVGMYAEARSATGAPNGLLAVSHAPSGTAVYANNDGGGTALHARSNGGDLARFQNQTGIVASIDRDGNLAAKNLPGITYTQSHDGSFEYYPGQSITVDEITINVPARGFIYVTASLQYGLQTADGFGAINFQLVNINNNGVETTARAAEYGSLTGGALTRGTLYVSWVIPADKGTLRLRTTSTNEGNCSTYVKDHALQAIFVPVSY
jgi:hypothetical protein